VADSDRTAVLPRPHPPDLRADFPGQEVPLARWSLRSAWRSTDAALRCGVLTHSDLTVAILAITGVVVWWESIKALPMLTMSDIGIASVLPLQTYAAFGLVGSSFVVAVRSGRIPAIVLSLVTTVLVLHGLGAVAEPEMRFHVAWRHIGIADYMRTRGAVNPQLDAYQNWPAFFGLTAFVWEATGVESLPAILTWTPVVLNLLYLMPLVVIGKRILGDPTLVWLAAWLFTVSNWIGQDYYSPQGWYLFIYISVLAVLLVWFSEPSARRPWSGRGLARAGFDGPPAAGGKGQHAALLAIVLVLAATAVSGHQLTPYALALSAGAAVMAECCRLRILPIILLLGTLAWTAYAATAYVAGHPDTFSQLGAITSIFEQTVEERLGGSPGHEMIVKLRLLETAVLWVLAAAGVLRLYRSGRRQSSCALAVLALSSFPLLAAQSYGGEALMRIAIFALPFMSVLAAVGLAGSPPVGRRPRTLVPFVLVGAVLVVAFPFTRYGNERMDWYTSDEVAGVQAMYELAPTASTITSVTGGLPWRATGYAEYEYRLLVDGFPVEVDPEIGSQGTVNLAAIDSTVLAEQVQSRMRVLPGQRSFLIVSRSQGAELDLMAPFPSGAQDRLVAALRASAAFRSVMKTQYVEVFELRGS
jgi:hypothetical protein